MSKYAELINNKPKLLILVVIGVIGSLSIPVLLPHFDHGAHIYHLLLHAGGIILSVFLTILGINAYYKIRSKKLAITSIAFFVFSWNSSKFSKSSGNNNGISCGNTIEHE